MMLPLKLVVGASTCFLVVGALSGCVLNGGHSLSVETQKEHTLLKRVAKPKGIVIKHYQSTQSAPYSVVLENSPWGGQLVASVEKQYYSAGGNYCVEISVLEEQKQLLCSKDEEHWFISKLYQ